MKHRWYVQVTTGDNFWIDADDMSMTSEGDISFLAESIAKNQDGKDVVFDTTVLAIIHRSLWEKVFIIGPAGENCIEFEYPEHAPDLSS